MGWVIVIVVVFFCVLLLVVRIYRSKSRSGEEASHTTGMDTNNAAEAENGE